LPEKNQKSLKSLVKTVSKNKIIWLNLAFLVIAYTVTVGYVATGAYMQQGYLVSIREASDYHLKAPFTVENRIATERNRQAAKDAADRLEPITTRVSTALGELNAHLEEFFAEADELRRNRVDIFTPYTEGAMIGSGITGLDPGHEIPAPTPTPVPRISGLTESATITLLGMDADRYDAFVQTVYSVSEIILENGVAVLDSRTLMSVKDEMDKFDFNSDVRSLGYDIITLYLRENIIIDEDATARARADRETQYDTVEFLEGETIVNDGQIVTEEIYAVLEELGMLRTDSIENIPQLLGVAMVLAALFIIAGLYMFFFTDRELGIRETALAFTVYILLVTSAWAMIEMPIQLLPLTIFVILMAAFLGVRTSIVMNLGATIACYMIVGADIEFLLYYSISGAAVALFAGKTTDRSHIFISALLVSVVNVVLFTGAALATRNYFNTDLLSNSVFAAMAGMLSVIISFGSMPVWEAAFGLVTPIRLLDLTNPDSKLLRKLAIEAPGTYHHSIIVANLAETAAYEIGANTSVARTGGYYHDIGKLEYPQYFVENMLGKNPHDEMDPLDSAHVIISHLEHGRELALMYKLPKVVQDIIVQHHGTTLLKYFYCKARENDPLGNLNEQDYRYPFEIPQSKEAAVVMLADTVEAAVRSMIPTGKGMKEVAAFTTQLVRDKLDDGQLRDSTLTIRDLDTVVNSFMRVFRGMYHERIPYPVEDRLKEPKTAADL